MRKGDLVVIKDPMWWQGENLGGRLAIVESAESYILLHVTEYDNNPVKCFRNEVSLVDPAGEPLPEDELDWDDLWNITT